MHLKMEREEEGVFIPQATAVNEKTMKVRIPDGLNPGDSFLVTPPDGNSFTAVVPDNGVGGAYVDIVVPSDENHH